VHGRGTGALELLSIQRGSLSGQKAPDIHKKGKGATKKGVENAQGENIPAKARRGKR